MNNKKEDNEKNELSFLGKIIYFFRSLYQKIRDMHLLRRISDREKKLAGYSKSAPETNAKAAYIFGMAKLAFIVLFVVLTVGILLFGGRIFSYNNMYYMFKDIGYISSYSESRPETLNYSRPVNNQHFASFKNGLAVVSDSEFKFFTATGRVTMTEGSGYVNPIIVTSNSHALIYDGGRNSYAIYNSFVKLHSETLDYPISQAHISSDGSYVIVTKSKKYASVVKIFDSNFKLVQEYSKNDYVISAEISDNGKYIAVASLDASEGESVVSVNILKVNSAEIYSQVAVRGDMPYKASFLSDDRIALFCADSFFVYDLKGNVKGKYRYSSDLSKLYVSDKAFVLAFSDDGLNRSNRVTLFDKNGNEIYTEKIEGNVRDISYGDNYIYVLRDTDVVRIDIVYGGKTYAAVSDGDARLQLLSNGEIALCTETTAYYIEFK